MPPVRRHAFVPPSFDTALQRSAMRTGDSELANFDLRETLADTQVHEASFSEFLALLKQAGHKPG